MAALVAVGFGAVVIEEMLSGSGKAAHGDALRHLVSLIRRCQAAPEGLGVETLSPDELDTMDELRPSLVAACPITRGEIITAEMLVCKAPFRGLSPNLLPLVAGRRALYDIVQDEPITFGVIDL
jgi:sialic acid synthase SpsE